jgi:hypothetical protein
LRQAFEQADAERKRLQAELGTTSQRLQATLAERDALNAGTAASRSQVERLGADLAFAVDSLPPDPRGGQVAVRAARLAAQRGLLLYSVALSHERRGNAPLEGQLQFVVTGASAEGAERAVSLQPVKLALERQAVARGAVPLPEGFRPRQATLRVLDRQGAQLGMRVMLVN